MKFNIELFLYFATVSQLVAGRELSYGRRLRKGKPPKRELEGGTLELQQVEDLAEGVTSNTATPEQLVEALLQDDSNLVISNVQFEGAPHAAGIFRASTENMFGFYEGIVLTTGDIKDIEGPNTAYNTTTNNQLPGDWDLDYFFFENTRMGTYDATSLSFDFECDGVAEVNFQYVFASEEYNEYVGSTYNDVFAFFLNGDNVAILPDGENTAINSVHCGNPAPLDGSAAVPPSSNCNLFIDNSDGHLYTEFDGLTTPLTAEGDAHGGVNTIKLVIADVADGKFDSAVFLQAGSFNCIAPTSPPTTAPTPSPTRQPTPSPTSSPTPQPTPSPTSSPTPQPTPEPTPNPTLRPAQTGYVGKVGATAGTGSGSLADIGGGGRANGGGGGETHSATIGRGNSVAKAAGEGSGATHGVAGGEGFGGAVGTGLGYGGGFGGEGSGYGHTGGATFGDSGGGGGGMGQAKAVTNGQNSVGGAVGNGDGLGQGFGSANIGSFGNGFGEGYGIGHKVGGDNWRRNRRRNLNWVPVAGGEGGGEGGAFQNSIASGIGAAGGGGGASVHSAKRGHSIASGGGNGSFGAFGNTAGAMNGMGNGIGFGSIDEDGNTYGHGESFGNTGGFADGEAGGGGMGSGWSNAQSNGQLTGAGAFGGGEGQGVGTGETTGGAMGTGFADGFAEMHWVPDETNAPVAAPTV